MARRPGSAPGVGDAKLFEPLQWWESEERGGGGGGNILSGEGISAADIARGLLGGGGSGGGIPIPGGGGPTSPVSPLDPSSYGGLGTANPFGGATGAGAVPTAAPSAAGAGGGLLSGLGSFFNTPFGLYTFGTIMNLLGGLIGGDDDGRESLRGGPADPEVFLAQGGDLARAAIADIAGRGPIEGAPIEGKQIEGIPFSVGALPGGSAAAPQMSHLLTLIEEILNESSGNARSRGDAPIRGRAVPRQPGV